MAGRPDQSRLNTLLECRGRQDHVRANGFSVVEDYTGHGVGRNLHKEPSCSTARIPPNVTSAATLAVEPSQPGKVCRRSGLLDRGPLPGRSPLSGSTVLVTSDGCEILTDRGDRGSAVEPSPDSVSGIGT